MNDFLFVVNKFVLKHATKKAFNFVCLDNDKLQILKAKPRVAKPKLNVRTANNNKINITTKCSVELKKHTQLLSKTFKIKADTHRNSEKTTKEKIDTEPKLFDVVFLDTVQFGQIQVSNQIEEFDADSSHIQGVPQVRPFAPQTGF